MHHLSQGKPDSSLSMVRATAALDAARNGDQHAAAARRTLTKSRPMCSMSHRPTRLLSAIFGSPPTNSIQRKHLILSVRCHCPPADRTALHSSRAPPHVFHALSPDDAPQCTVPAPAILHHPRGPGAKVGPFHALFKHIPGHDPRISTGVRSLSCMSPCSTQYVCSIVDHSLLHRACN